MSVHMVRRADIDAGVERVKPETLAVLQSGDYERAEAGTGRRFITARFDYMEGHINNLSLVAQNKKKPAFKMSADAIRAIEEAVSQVLQFTPVPRHEKVRSLQRGTHIIRRTDIVDCQLPKCTCEGGAEHRELPVDAILDGIRDAFRGVAEAVEAEEAHVHACVADGLGCIFSAHSIMPKSRKLWEQAKPPTVVRITSEEFRRYQAWDGRWKITAHHSDGTVDACFDHWYRFERALNLEAEEAAREKPRAIIPPVDWMPTVRSSPDTSSDPA